MDALDEAVLGPQRKPTKALAWDFTPRGYLRNLKAWQKKSWGGRFVGTAVVGILVGNFFVEDPSPILWKQLLVSVVIFALVGSIYMPASEIDSQDSREVAEGRAGVVSAVVAGALLGLILAINLVCAVLAAVGMFAIAWGFLDIGKYNGRAEIQDAYKNAVSAQRP